MAGVKTYDLGAFASSLAKQRAIAKGRVELCRSLVKLRSKRIARPYTRTRV